MDRHRTNSNLPGFFDLVARGQGDQQEPDHPDTRPSDQYPVTEWLPIAEEKWTDPVMLDAHYGLALSTYVEPKQANAPIKISTLYMSDTAEVVMNYEQFIELYKQIRVVGEGIRHKADWRVAYLNIPKLHGRDVIYVRRGVAGLLVERVFISSHLCDAISTVKGPVWQRVVDFFKNDVVLYPPYVPGFLL